MEDTNTPHAHERATKKSEKSWKTRLASFGLKAADKLATAAVCLALAVIYQKVTTPKTNAPVA